VIGEVGILDELDLIGVPHIGGPHEAKNTIELKPGFAVPHDHDVGGAFLCCMHAVSHCLHIYTFVQHSSTHQRKDTICIHVIDVQW
jgi:hypothetical protein